MVLGFGVWGFGVWGLGVGVGSFNCIACARQYMCLREGRASTKALNFREG